MDKTISGIHFIYYYQYQNKKLNYILKYIFVISDTTPGLTNMSKKKYIIVLYIALYMTLLSLLEVAIIMNFHLISKIRSVMGHVKIAIGQIKV